MIKKKVEERDEQRDEKKDGAHYSFSSCAVTLIRTLKPPLLEKMEYQDDSLHHLATSLLVFCLIVFTQCKITFINPE